MSASNANANGNNLVSPLPSSLPDPTIHITTHNSDGQAAIESTSKNTWTWYEGDTMGFNVAYTTSTFPANLNDEADIKAHKQLVSKGDIGLVRPGGTVCRIVDFGPGHKPVMHRTQSLDYGVVLEGEIEMKLDDGSSRILKKHDVAVQRGTSHAWANHSPDKWVRMLFVLQDCEPITVAGKRLGEELGRAAQFLPPSGHDDVLRQGGTR